MSRFDLIVIRYGKDLTAKDLSKTSKPVISAGGESQHVTQALLDSLVMADTAGVENFTELYSKVVFAGHTRGYRAAHSLARLLREHTKCGLENLVPYLGMPMDEKWGLHSYKKLGIWPYPPIEKDEYWAILETAEPLTLAEISEEKKMVEEYLTQVEDAIRGADYLYIPRPTIAFPAKENMTADDIVLRKQTIVYGITPPFIEKVAKPDMKIMHPLPRTEKRNEYTIVELDEAFDGTKRDLYSKLQPEAGTQIRQALLAGMIGND